MKNNNSFFYYLTIGSVMIAGLFLLQLMQWLNSTQLKLSSDDVPLLTAPAVYFLSFPIVFLFWIYALRDYYRFELSFSLVACIISVISFVFAAGLNIKIYHHAVILFSAIGCFSGAFVFINLREFLQHAFSNQRLSSVAMIGAAASGAYSLIDNYMWQRIAYSSTKVSQFLLELLNIEMRSGISKGRHDLASTLISDNFTLYVYRPCSGLEGIFLFIFLLSIAVLFDWKILKKIKLIETYLIGFIFMYLVNIIRIVSLFILGHFAHDPDASSFMSSLRGLPAHIFHSFAGQIYYLIFFMIFAQVVYSYARARNQK